MGSFGFDFPTALLREVAEQITEQQATARQEAFDALTAGDPGAPFDAAEVWDLFTTQVADLENMKRAAIKLGVANNILELALTQIEKQGLPLKQNLGRGRMGRVRRRRRRIGATTSVPVPAFGLGQIPSNGDVAERYIAENRADSIQWFQIMLEQAQIQVELADQRGDIRGAAWASNVGDWSSIVIQLLQGVTLTEAEAKFVVDQTPRMVRHMKNVLQNQADLFRDLGDVEKEVLTLRVLDRLRAVEEFSKAVKRDPGAASQGLSGLGFAVSTLVLIGMGVVLLVGLGVAYAGTKIAGSFTAAANAKNNEIELQRELASKVASLRDEARTLRAAGRIKEAEEKEKEADSVEKIAVGQPKPLGFLQASSEFLKTVLNVALWGAGLWVAWRLVGPFLTRRFSRGAVVEEAPTGDRKQPDPGGKKGKGLTAGGFGQLKQLIKKGEAAGQLDASGLEFLT
jgi:hypothetical protein